MVEWTAAYINDLPDSAFACIDPGGDKDHLRAHARALEVGDANKMTTAVKFLKGSDTEIEGLAIPFGGPLAGKDFEGEDFGPDTDFAFDWFPDGRPTIYEHGLDGAMKTVVAGRQYEHEVVDEGVWARAQLDRSARYFGAVKRLIDQGRLFFSTGSMPHLVRSKGGHITHWPWVELSLTPTPANPYAVVHAVKSTDLVERLEAAGLALPAELVARALKSLDDPDPEDTEALLAGSSFADDADRVLEGVEVFRDRAVSLVDLRAKSGRVLSRATRERLARHPGSLRELADDLDALLSDADADKQGGKSIELTTLERETERLLSRSLGVALD